MLQVFILLYFSHYADSLHVEPASKRTSINLNAFFNQISNWQYVKGNYAFVHFRFYRYEIYKGYKWNKELEFDTEHTLRFFPDSVLLIDRDEWEVDLRFTEPGQQKIGGTFSLHYSSRFFNRYEEYDDEKKWREGFAVPSALELGYGFQYHYSPELSFGFDVSSFRLQLQSTGDDALSTNEFFVDIGDLFLSTRLGFKSRILIDKDLTDNIRWSYRSDIFLSGLDRKNINAALQNDISLRVYKGIQLNVISELRYDPYFSEKSQWSNRITMGFDLFKSK